MKINAISIDCDLDYTDLARAAFSSPAAEQGQFLDTYMFLLAQRSDPGDLASIKSQLGPQAKKLMQELSK
jgi:hypothetical protein